MSETGRKTLIYGALLLAACGCLSIVVLLGGVAAYGLLHFDLGISDQDIGLDPGDLMNVPLFGLESQGGAAEPPGQSAAQPESPQAVSSPESAYTEEAQKECAKFSDAFPQLSIIMAWKTADELTCGFGSEGSQKYVALVGISEYETQAEAAQAWAGEWGSESPWATAVSNYAQAAPARYTYNHEGSRFFLATQVLESGQLSYYTMNGGRLYGNAIIEFRDERASSNATTEWETVESVAMGLVSAHNAE